VTDLPRFYQGEFGKLDFSHLNEMMKRLDVLLPIVQAAAAGGGWSAKERPLIFPVYAERTGNTTEAGNAKYRWWEVSIVDDEIVWPDDEVHGDIDTQLRKGGAGEEEGVDEEDDADNSQFGLLAVDPLDGGASEFQTGFAIAFVIRSGISESSTGGVRCLLFPLSSATGTTYCMIDGEPSVASMQVGKDSRTVHEYPAQLLGSATDIEGSSEFTVINDEVTAVDLNAFFTNRPTITGSDTILESRFYDPGTIFMVTKIGNEKYAFTHLVRFDVTCT